MKSLEIINSNIRLLKKQLYKLKDVQEGTNEDILKYTIECELKELEQIKQDLEVLEIIRKKKVDVRLLAIYIFIPSSDEEKLKNYNKHCKHVNHELTMEELLKLKQWLEENENDR